MERERERVNKHLSYANANRHTYTHTYAHRVVEGDSIVVLVVVNYTERDRATSREEEKDDACGSRLLHN